MGLVVPPLLAGGGIGFGLPWPAAVLLGAAVTALLVVRHDAQAEAATAFCRARYAATLARDEQRSEQ